jgi:hypothetical protein
MSETESQEKEKNLDKEKKLEEEGGKKEISPEGKEKTSKKSLSWLKKLIVQN